MTKKYHNRLFIIHMQQKRAVLRLFFMAKHSFIKTVAKLYFAVAKEFLFSLVVPFTFCQYPKKLFYTTCSENVLY